MRFADTMAAIVATNPGTLDVLDRYETRYVRIYHRAHSEMRKLRRERGLPVRSPKPNSPSPKNLK